MSETGQALAKFGGPALRTVRRVFARIDVVMCFVDEIESTAADRQNKSQTVVVPLINEVIVAAFCPEPLPLLVLACA